MDWSERICAGRRNSLAYKDFVPWFDADGVTGLAQMLYKRYVYQTRRRESFDGFMLGIEFIFRYFDH